MADARRRWLRAVLYRTGVQGGWLWLAAVAWFAVWGLPQGRWNRTFDGRATAVVTSIEVERGAEDPDIQIHFSFRANGREYTNYSVDVDAGRDIAVGRELEVAYVSTDPTYAELRAPGVRSRYGPLSFELTLVGVFALAGILVIAIDIWRGHRESRRARESHATKIAERKPPVIWFLFVLPLATLAGIATLVILYYA